MPSGLEMLAIGKTKYFEINYDMDAKRYIDNQGRYRDDILDAPCYGCAKSYYTIRGDAIEFCPMCGFFDRRQFKTFEELKDITQNQNFGFLARSTKPFAFAIRAEGIWLIKFARHIGELQANRRIEEIKEIYPAKS